MLKRNLLGKDRIYSIGMNQIHGKRVIAVDKSDVGKVIPDCDGLITNFPGLYLRISAADCIPVFLYDPINNSIAAVHAGWRGLDKNIIKSAVTLMIKKFSTNPKKLYVRLGPHICQKHYEVGQSVAQKFSNYPGVLKKQNMKIFLDLGKVAIKQLTNLGVPTRNIEFDGRCTFEEKDLASYRRDPRGGVHQYFFKLP